MADEWPIHLLIPRDPDWQLVGAAMSGGQPVIGPPNYANMTGGPYWRCDHGGVWAHKATQIKTGRALQALADGGSTSFIVASCEGRLVPSGGAPSGTVPHSDGTPFSDGTEYLSSGSASTVATAAVLRSVTLRLTLPAGMTLEGGEDFSINHPTKGPRRYRIARITAVDGLDSIVTVRPPLREAVDGGEDVEFANPRCLMVLTNAQAFISALQGNRFADMNPQFVEAP